MTKICEVVKPDPEDLNNSVTFSGKPIRTEEFLIQIVEALDITIDRHPKGKPRKMES